MELDGFRHEDSTPLINIYLSIYMVFMRSCTSLDIVVEQWILKHKMYDDCILTMKHQFELIQ